MVPFGLQGASLRCPCECPVPSAVCGGEEEVCFGSGAHFRRLIRHARRTADDGGADFNTTLSRALLSGG